MGITSSGPRHPDQASGQPGAQRRGSELQTLSPTWLGVEGGGSPDLSSPLGNLDGAIARGSGGGSAGGRHLAQAPGQPGAACAPLGEQAPPFAALIRHRTGGGWIFGVFSIRRQSSTERGRGRWESRPRDPGTRTRPRGSPGQHARLWASKRRLLQPPSCTASGGPDFRGVTAPNGIHRWIPIRVVRNHLISTQASGSGLGAARGSTPRFGTQNSLPCIAWRSWRRGRVSPRF